jgi:hypothetical protein
MSNYLVKGHNAIMRQTAVNDFNAVVNELKLQKREDLIKYPKGASWQKIEDATALMIKAMSDVESLTLNRGLSYYKSL